MTSSIDTADNGLRILYRGRRGMVAPARQVHRDTWDTLLCEGVPLSVKELVLLTADALGAPVNMDIAHTLLRCKWSLGWHVHTFSSKSVSRHYWGGGVTPRTTSNYLRGDWVETNISDTRRGVTTSRLARVICGAEVSRLAKNTGFEIPEHTWETDDNNHQDRAFFLLVRYAQSHPRANRRGPDHRPLCPGILQDTHCLWSWSKRPVGFQRGCLRGRPWDRNKHFFGETEASQTRRKDLEQRAWYDLIQTSNITRYANVQTDPDKDDAFLQSIMWC